MEKDPETEVKKRAVFALSQLPKDEAVRLLIQVARNNRNQVVRREAILHQVWGEDNYYIGRSLDVFVSRLRKMFADDDRIQIENVRGVGFKFIVNE